MSDSAVRGRVVLVTGASSGAGAEIAREMARQGARVAVNYRRSTADAERVVRGIGEAGGEAAAFQADVGHSADLRRLVEAVTASLGPVDVLVNNAGPFADTPFRRLAEADWDAIMDANLKAVYVAAQLVAPGMMARGWGRIVNVGATSGLVRSHSVYGLAKGALLHLTESLALELAPHITVNAVVPSQIQSARTDRMPAYKAAAIAATPLGRLVTEGEIARMVALLCSPAFDFVTGRHVIMDGGRSLPVFPRLDLGAGAEPPADVARPQPPAVSVTVRSAGAEEAATVHGIMRQAFEEYRGRLDPPSGALAETVDDVRAAIAGGGAFLAFAGGMAVGSARFRLLSDHAYAGRVAVLPAYRGQGIASALMAAIEAGVRAVGVAEVRVGVRGSLQSNLRLYHGLGYRVLSSRPYPTGTDTDITLGKHLG